MHPGLSRCHQGTGSKNGDETGRISDDYQWWSGGRPGTYIRWIGLVPMGILGRDPMRRFSDDVCFWRCGCGTSGVALHASSLACFVSLAERDTTHHGSSHRGRGASRWECPLPEAATSFSLSHPLQFGMPVWRWLAGPHPTVAVDAAFPPFLPHTQTEVD